MIPADLPQQLTSDGIRQLLNPSYSGSSFEFILQLEKLSEDYSGNKMYSLRNSAAIFPTVSASSREFYWETPVTSNRKVFGH